MKKVARGQNCSGVRLLGGGRGGHRWRFHDKVTTKIVPNITNLFYAVFYCIEYSLSLWHLQVLASHSQFSYAFIMKKKTISS